MSDAKDYITKREIPQLFECLMTGLMYHRPGDHVAYLQDCLEKIKAKGVSSVRWDLFLEAKRAKTPLPPVTPPNRSSRPTSSRASSRASSLFDKKPVLPPIASAAADGSAGQPRLARELHCPVLLLIGGPGSGKASVGRFVADRYGYALISAGRMLGKFRSESADGMAPDSTALAALIGAINEATASGGCKGLVIEGYPRSMQQLEDYLEHIHRIDSALLLDYEEASLQERLLAERHDEPGGIARRISAFKSACLPACRVLDDEGKLLVLPVDPGAGDQAVGEEAVRLLDVLLTPASESAAAAAAAARASGDAARAAAPAGGQSVVSIRRLANVGRPARRDGAKPPLALLMGGPGSGRSSCLERLARLNEGRTAILDLTDCRDDEEKAVARLQAAEAAGKPIIVKGFPDSEEALRAMYARVGAPDLAVLIDCLEADMMERLAEAGPHSADTAAARMARFKEETLPVVQHLDEAGLLCVVLGDKHLDDVLKEVKSLLDFVLFNQAEASASLAQQNLPVAEAAVKRLRARLEGAGGHSEEEAAAAAKIQAGFRGFQVRKRQVEASAAKQH